MVSVSQRKSQLFVDSGVVTEPLVAISRAMQAIRSSAMVGGPLALAPAALTDNPNSQESTM